MLLLARPYGFCLLLLPLSSQDGLVLHAFTLHFHRHHHLFLLSDSPLDILLLPVQEVGGDISFIHAKDSVL